MDGIKPHKHMAGMAGSKDGVSGSFGIEPFHQVNGGEAIHSVPGGHKMPHGHNDAMMHDHERGVGKHVARGKGMMPAQRHPDHGPHGHKEEPDSGSFGIGGFKSAANG